MTEDRDLLHRPSLRGQRGVPSQHLHALLKDPPPPDLVPPPTSLYPYWLTTQTPAALAFSPFRTFALAGAFPGTQLPWLVPFSFSRLQLKYLLHP